MNVTCMITGAGLQVLPEDDFIAAAKHAQADQLQSDLSTSFPVLLNQAMEAAYAHAAHIQQACLPLLQQHVMTLARLQLSRSAGLEADQHLPCEL